MNNLWIFKVAFVIMAVPLLASGLQGVITKRPFLVPLRRFVWIMSVPVLLSVAAVGWLIFDSPFNDSPFNAFDFLGIFFLVVFLLVFGITFFVVWKQTDGYSAFGVTDESFQEALHSALNKLNLPFEETIFRLRLTSIGADLQANVQSSMGFGHLTIKQSEHRQALKNIADAMNEYFRTTSVKLNMAASIYQIIMGALVIIAANF
jgi:hypothetical protein